MLPVYAANPDEQILMDVSQRLTNPDNLVHTHFDLAKNFVFYYGKSLLVGGFDEGSNYVFKKQEYLTHDFIQQNSYYFKYFFGESIINLEKFYKNH
jgi:hypothetical protein